MAYYILYNPIAGSGNAETEIEALSAFCGGQRDTLETLVKQYNEKNSTSVHFVNGSDWIPPQPLHPLRDGHITVANHLTPILKEIFEL